MRALPIPYVEMRDLREGSVRGARPDGVGALMKMGVEKGRGVRPGPEDRDLRRTRRRPVQRRVLPSDRPELRELLPVPRADRAAGGGARAIAWPMRPRRRRRSSAQSRKPAARSAEVTAHRGVRGEPCAHRRCPVTCMSSRSRRPYAHMKLSDFRYPLPRNLDREIPRQPAG